jgi:DNA primase
MSTKTIVVFVCFVSVFGGSIMAFDTEVIKRDTDLLDLVGRDTTLKRAASTRGGEYVGPCPFCGGEDRFNVWPNDDPPGWWCRQCERHGDAIDYVKQRDGVGFTTACQHLGGEGARLKSVTVVKGKPVVRPSPQPLNEEWQTAAVQIRAYCAAMLWEPEGEDARHWLNARGLADETLKRHYIGFNKAGRKLYGLWVPRGITIPHWQESLNRIWGIKIRLATNGPDKYRAVKGSVPCLYLADDLEGREVAVICEGEFDALLLTQEAGDLVGVVALGSAANKVRAINAGLPFLLEVNRLLVATDNDEEGERAAAYLLERTKRARRLRVPEGNDVTDFWKGGGDLREWVEAFTHITANRED